MTRKIPEHLMKVLRQRMYDLEEDDKSKDYDIEAMPPAYLFEELLGWELGDRRWGTTILEWLDDLGLDVRPKSQRNWVDSAMSKLSEPEKQALQEFFKNGGEL